jgi:glycosyltransferase involved in cell wall biosynthesis
LTADLAASGVETHVATTDDDGPKKLDVRYGEPVVQGNVTYWYFPRQMRFYTFSWPLCVWLSQHVSEFDLVHIHALFSFAALPAAYWSRRRRVPYIVMPHGMLNVWGMTQRRPWLKRASFRLLEARILKHAARIHYNSEQERCEAERLGVTCAPAVIPNALPPFPVKQLSGAFLECYPQLRGRRIILFLSRLDPKKGLDLLVRAFADVRRRVPNASLVIAGDGPREFVDRIKADIEELGIASDVVWTGFLSGQDKQAAFADADVFALSSYSENFGIAVVEAMAARVPVVVSDQVALHQEISAAGAGLVVPCKVSEVADALVAILTVPPLRHSLGVNGEMLARRQYSSDVVTRQMISVYADVAPCLHEA